MGLLSYNELKQLVARKVITNVQDSQINGTSIDITLGEFLLVEKARGVVCAELPLIVDLGRRDALDMERVCIPAEGYVLQPDEFVLAQSEQMFYMPLNLSCEYKLKSSTARVALNNLTAGWCDPGWTG